MRMCVLCATIWRSLAIVRATSMVLGGGTECACGVVVLASKLSQTMPLGKPKSLSIGVRPFGIVGSSPSPSLRSMCVVLLFFFWLRNQCPRGVSCVVCRRRASGCRI
jgi:hypothetical protein